MGPSTTSLLACNALLAALLACALLGCGKSRRAAHTNVNANNRPGSASGTQGSWTKQLGDTNPQSVNAVAIDGNGEILAAGYGCGSENGGTGTIDFGGGPKQMPGACGLFVVAYSQDGQLRWSFADGEPGVKTEADAMVSCSPSRG